MIKLSKGAIPGILERSAPDWTRIVLDKLVKGEDLTTTERRRYAHPEIKAALVAETHGKCAYCESKLRHVAHGDVEHIAPKSIVPERWFDWQNLTLVCDLCNGNKSDYYGDHDTFIDPYVLDPEVYFLYFGPIVWPRPDSEAASITARLLDLNRADLVERRAERLGMLKKHLEVIEQTSDAQLKAILYADFLEETRADKEFAALAREFARWAEGRVGLPLTEEAA